MLGKVAGGLLVGFILYFLIKNSYREPVARWQLA